MSRWGREIVRRELSGPAARAALQVQLSTVATGHRRERAARQGPPHRFPFDSTIHNSTRYGFQVAERVMDRVVDGDADYGRGSRRHGRRGRGYRQHCRR